MDDLVNRGNWLQTYTGGKFYPLDPRPDEIRSLDIAHALGHICRFGGHTLRFYSVAEHCVALSYAVRPELALWALLHDAAEAYIGDMVRPLKRHLLDYVWIEDRILGAIAAKYGLTGGEIPAEVRDADNRILLAERAEFLAPTPDRWTEEDLIPLPVALSGWDPHEAENRYLARLEDLTWRARP